MTLTDDAERLFTERRESYVRFIRFVRYPQGLEAFLVRSPLLRADLRILEAGSGAGALTFAVWRAMAQRGLRPAAYHAFDLTPAMLDDLRGRLRREGIDGIELRRANVLRLDDLPPSWTGYDLVVTASMLEYVPRDAFPAALAGLRARLRPGGSLLLFVTRRNPITRLLIGRWWDSNLYTAEELRRAFADAGFVGLELRQFPLVARHLAAWGRIVEARRPAE